MAQRTNLFLRQCLVLLVRGWLCHTAHASSQKKPPTFLRSFNIGAPKMNSHTDLFAGDWFFVPKWKAQAIVNFNKGEMEREIHTVVCREKEMEKEMACREKEMEREIHTVMCREKEMEKEMACREKEMEREIHTVMCREKEMEKEMACREKEMEKEMACREKEMEREIHTVKMQMKEEQLQMTGSMARLELSLQYERKESLRAKGLLTGRGVLEFALKQVHHERKLQKNFNAQRTCESLDVTAPQVNTDAWKLQQCYEEMCRQHPGARLSEKSIGKALEYVYGVLSHEIHGYPWSDESVVLLLILMLQGFPYLMEFSSPLHMDI